MNPVAVATFIGMVLTVVVYSVLDLTGLMSRLGKFGPILPLILICWLVFGIYIGLKRLKQRPTRIRIKGPLFMRSLMNDCLDRTCGVLKKKMKVPHITSVTILNEILQDKMLFICASDCQHFSDIRRQIEGSRLKGSDDLQLARFFQSDIQYAEQDLPDEIKQIHDTIQRSRTDLKNHLDRLKQAHRKLCTGSGDLVSLLPPDGKKVGRIRSTYRYHPPTKQHAQRMVFALETMRYLKAIRHENVNPMDLRRYESVAVKVIPDLANAVNFYNQAWKAVVNAYEQPHGSRFEDPTAVENSISPP